MTSPKQPNTLSKELQELENLIRKIADYFKDDRLTTMSVILQNMAFRADEDSRWTDFDKQLEILKLNKEYRPDCHVSQWIYSEVKMITDGHRRNSRTNWTNMDK